MLAGNGANSVVLSLRNLGDIEAATGYFQAYAVSLDLIDSNGDSWAAPAAHRTLSILLF